jgi:thiamine biosynthesis protein ThiS
METRPTIHGSKPASIIANGESKPIDLPCTVEDFIKQSGWRPTQVVVEHNGSVLTRSSLQAVQLKDGDRLEVIVPVAGG